MTTKKDKLAQSGTRLKAGLDNLGKSSTQVKEHPASPNQQYRDRGFYIVAVDDLQPDRDQPRKTFDPEELDEMAQSIRNKGLIQPVTFRLGENGQCILVCGERRWRAAKAAGLTHIPAMLRTDKNYFEISLIENLQRQNLNPIEEAEAYEKMIKEYKYTHEMLATAVGKARATITSILSLNQLPETIKQECARAHIPKRALIEIARMGTDQQKIDLFEKMKQGVLTSVDIREISSKKKSQTIRSRREIFSTRISGLASYLTKIKLAAWSGEDRDKALENLQALKTIIDKIMAEQK